MTQASSIPWLDQIAQGGGSPAMVYLPAAVGLIAGVVLLLAGGKVLRPIAMLLGGAVGGLGGSLLLPGLLPATIYGLPGTGVAMGIGAVVGLVAAAVLFRAAMATAGAVTFAAAGILGATISLGGMPTELPSFAGVENLATHRVVAASFPLRGAEPRPTEAAGQVAQQLWGDATSAWGSLPAESQMRLLISGLGAGLLGLIIGALMPKRAAALVTALFGAGAALASLTWIAQTAEWPGRGLLEHGPMGWLMLWAVVAGAGVTFQLCGQIKSAPKPRPATA
jgi:hypothetical protein